MFRFLPIAMSNFLIFACSLTLLTSVAQADENVNLGGTGNEGLNRFCSAVSTMITDLNEVRGNSEADVIQARLSELIEAAQIYRRQWSSDDKVRALTSLRTLAETFKKTEVRFTKQAEKTESQLVYEIDRRKADRYAKFYDQTLKSAETLVLAELEKPDSPVAVRIESIDKILSAVTTEMQSEFITKFQQHNNTDETAFAKSAIESFLAQPKPRRRDFNQLVDNLGLAESIKFINDLGEAALVKINRKRASEIAADVGLRAFCGALATCAVGLTLSHGGYDLKSAGVVIVLATAQVLGMLVSPFDKARLNFVLARADITDLESNVGVRRNAAYSTREILASCKEILERPVQRLEQQ